MVNSWEFVHVDYLDVQTMDGHQCDGGWFSVNHHLLCLIGVYVQVAEFIPDDEVGDDLPILQVVCIPVGRQHGLSNVHAVI